MLVEFTLLCSVFLVCEWQIVYGLHTEEWCF